MGLALTQTMHSRPGLPDLLALLPPSTVAAAEVLLVMTTAAPDFLLSQKANTGESAFPASSLSWIGQRFGDAWPQFSDPQANAKLSRWIWNQCICPPHNKLAIKHQETWQSLPLLKTYSLPPPCKMTYRFSSSTKCFRHYLNLQHHERPEWWTSCTALDVASQAGREPTGESQEKMSRSKKQDSQRKTSKDFWTKKGGQGISLTC